MGDRKESQTSEQQETDEVSRSLNGSTEAELHFEERGVTHVLKERASQNDFSEITTLHNPLSPSQ